MKLTVAVLIGLARLMLPCTLAASEDHAVFLGPSDHVLDAKETSGVNPFHNWAINE